MYDQSSWTARSRRISRFDSHTQNNPETKISLRSTTGEGLLDSRDSIKQCFIKRQRHLEFSDTKNQLSRKDFISLFKQLASPAYDDRYRALESLFRYFQCSLSLFPFYQPFTVSLLS